MMQWMFIFGCVQGAISLDQLNRQDCPDYQTTPNFLMSLVHDLYNTIYASSMTSIRQTLPYLLCIN